MDSKNVIAAISLSAAVIILYGLFFAPEPKQIQDIQDNQKNELVQNSEIPKLEETNEVEKICGFPPGWTNTGMPERWRFFCMGNALVVGLIEKMGKTLLK